MEFIINIFGNHIIGDAFEYFSIKRNSIDFILHACQVIIDPVILIIGVDLIGGFVGGDEKRDESVDAWTETGFCEQVKF